MKRAHLPSSHAAEQGKCDALLGQTGLNVVKFDSGTHVMVKRLCSAGAVHLLGMPFSFGCALEMKRNMPVADNLVPAGLQSREVEGFCVVLSRNGSYTCRKRMRWLVRPLQISACRIAQKRERRTYGNGCVASLCMRGRILLEAFACRGYRLRAFV